MPSLLTQERLMELLTYDPLTGEFRWKSTCGIAGSRDTAYCQIRVDGGRYYAHRLAFLYMTGNFPNGLVDHINRNRRDNRWANLREASYSQNAVNTVTHSTRSSPKGVRRTKYGRFQARIKVSGKNIYIGNFADPESASAAYRKASVDAFGEFTLTANKE